MTTKHKKWKNIGVWTVSAIVAIAMIGAGWAKVADTEMIVHNFSKWGYPHWFRYLIGILEIVSSILLLIPKTRVYGASVIGTLMVGAVWTHIAAAEYHMTPVPGLLLALSAILLYNDRAVVQKWLPKQRRSTQKAH